MAPDPAPRNDRYGGTIRDLLISVDVETAGPNPGTFALLSIGACLMDDPEVGFYIELVPDRHDALSEALAVSGLSLEELAERGTPPAEALQQWADWIAEVTPSDARPVMAAFNAPFDWMFVCDYFQRYLGRNPLGHAALDIKAWAMGHFGVAWRDTNLAALSELFLPGTVLAHNALEDARDQAALFRAMRDRPYGLPASAP